MANSWTLTDIQVIEYLREIDEGDEDVSDWEAGFLETVLEQNDWLSDKQRPIAEQMLEKYLDI